MQEKKAKIINSIVPNYSPSGSGMMDCLTPHTLFSLLGPHSSPREKNFHIHLKMNLLKGNAPNRQCDLETYNDALITLHFPFRNCSYTL